MDTDLESKFTFSILKTNMEISLVLGFVVIRLNLVSRFGNKSTDQFPKY